MIQSYILIDPVICCVGYPIDWFDSIQQKLQEKPKLILIFDDQIQLLLLVQENGQALPRVKGQASSYVLHFHGVDVLAQEPEARGVGTVCDSFDLWDLAGGARLHLLVDQLFVELLLQASVEGCVHLRLRIFGIWVLTGIILILAL